MNGRPFSPVVNGDVTFGYERCETADTTEYQST